MMAKKYFQRALSVGLSLALCAGLAAPAFAASFNELNDAVNKDTYDESKFEVIQTESERTVKLLEKVIWENGNVGSIDVNGKTVTIDLNGYDITANGSGSSSAIWVRDGADFTLTDTSDGPDGKITNAGKSAVWVGKDSTFTMEGGELSGNHTTAANAGGGVTVVNGGQFNMKDGVIKDNTSQSQADNVFVNGAGTDSQNTTELNVTGGQILGEGGGNGSVSAIGGKAEFTMDEDAYVEGSIVADQGAKVTANGGAASNGQEFDGFTVRDEQGNETLVAKGETFTAESKSTLDVKYAEPVAPEVPEVPEASDPGVVEIDEPAVPLAAGPVTRAEFIDYLWRHEDAPEGGVCTFTDVSADHEFVLALAWAEQNGIVTANEDGAFEPDELVTVAAVREFLGNFARVYGMDVDVYTLVSLTGDEDEAVLNCDEVLAEFFGEEYSAGENAA